MNNKPNNLTSGEKFSAAKLSDVKNMYKNLDCHWSELGDDSAKPSSASSDSNNSTLSSSGKIENSSELSLKYMSSFSEFGDDSVKNEHGYGVFRENEAEDIAVLVNNFSAPSLARALREREEILQICAALCAKRDIEEMEFKLAPFLKHNVDKRRQKKRTLDIRNGFNRKDLVIIQRYLHRMPRQVFQAAKDRASVVIPLCNDDGVACILFQRRSATVRMHKHEVCFPGGMVDEQIDSTIIQTSLREMREELGVSEDKVDVLGILRCNWTEVASMTGNSRIFVSNFIFIPFQLI